jgi:hypothetical protein
MEKEFQEIIQKNLPAQVGEALKKRLEVADQADNEIPRSKSEIRNLQISNAALQEKIDEKDKIESMISIQQSQLEKIEKEQHDLDLEKLRIQLEVEKDKSSFVKDIAMGLVRNQEFRRRLFDSKSGPESVDQYGNARYATHTVSSDETKTVA